jgi:hypothetical protein
MKRLIPFLILAAFFLGVSGSSWGRSHAALRICSTPQSHPQLSYYLPSEDGSGNWDAADQPLSPPGHLVLTLNPLRHDFLPWDCPQPTSPKHYARQGLGCGGLPS